MILKESTSAFISTLIISALLMVATTASAQKHYVEKNEKDSVALLQSVEISADAIGPLMRAIGDYGHYETALRVNLKGRYFPIFELGYGKTDHKEELTGIKYKTAAPYFKFGMDFNILRNKLDNYRLYVGARYAFTSFKYDIDRFALTDPLWGGPAPYSAHDVEGKCQWFEAVFGVQAKLIGPVHLGWSLRYRARFSHKNGDVGDAWYIPGYGENGSSVVGGTLNLIIVI